MGEAAACSVDCIVCLWRSDSLSVADSDLLAPVAAALSFKSLFEEAGPKEPSSLGEVEAATWESPRDNDDDEDDDDTTTPVRVTFFPMRTVVLIPAGT